MAEDVFVEYKSRAGKTRVYRVLGAFTDEIMYGPRKGQKIRCLRLEKPWAPGESFSAVRSSCKRVYPEATAPAEAEMVPASVSGQTELSDDPYDVYDAERRALDRMYARESGIPF